MSNKMLIDATHPEETRVVVLRGNRVEEFDFEAADRRQLRGNIYLAKVTRVEPSLQAAFVAFCALMGAFTIARSAAGRLSASRRACFDSTAILWHYTVAQGCLSLGLTHGFPLLAG